MASRQFRALIKNQWYHWTDIPAPTLAGMINTERPDITMFTGLDDKVGNKVFEGDVLVNNEGLKAKIIWDDKRPLAGFSLVDLAANLPVAAIYVHDQWLIIGNVFEGKQYQ